MSSSNLRLEIFANLLLRAQRDQLGSAHLAGEFLQLQFHLNEIDFGAFDVAYILAFLDGGIVVGADPVGIGLVDRVALALELILKTGVVEFDELVAHLDLGAVVHDPFDGGGVGGPADASLDADDDVVVLGRFQGAALDDRHEQFFFLGGPGRSGERLAHSHPWHDQRGDEQAAAQHQNPPQRIEENILARGSLFRRGWAAGRVSRPLPEAMLAAVLSDESFVAGFIGTCSYDFQGQRFGIQAKAALALDRSGDFPEPMPYLPWLASNCPCWPPSERVFGL